MPNTLILGGARSGKSRYALELGESLSDDRVFVATGVGFDEGMRERIARHRTDRDPSWRTVEESVAIWDVSVFPRPLPRLFNQPAQSRRWRRRIPAPRANQRQRLNPAAPEWCCQWR